MYRDVVNLLKNGSSAIVWIDKSINVQSFGTVIDLMWLSRLQGTFPYNFYIYRLNIAYVT